MAGEWHREGKSYRVGHVSDVDPGGEVTDRIVRRDLFLDLAPTWLRSSGPTIRVERKADRERATVCGCRGAENLAERFDSEYGLIGAAS